MNKNIIIFSIVAIVLLLGIAGWIWWSKNQIIPSTTEFQTPKISTQTSQPTMPVAKSALEKDLDSISGDLTDQFQADSDLDIANFNTDIDGLNSDTFSLL